MEHFPSVNESFSRILLRLPYDDDQPNLFIWDCSHTSDNTSVIGGKSVASINCANFMVETKPNGLGWVLICANIEFHGGCVWR